MALAGALSHLEAGRFEELAQSLEDAELEEPGALSSEQWPHALHLLALVYAGRLEDARFMWKRTPEAVRQGSPELAAAFALLQRLWVRDYQHLWAALQFGWSPQAQPLVAALAARLRGRQLELVGRAYSSISLPKLAALLGCAEAEAAQAAAAAGWQPGEGGLLEIPAPAAAPASGGAAEVAAQRSLQRLTEYVVHLEG